MKCSKCQMKNKSGAIFCVACGEKLPEKKNSFFKSTSFLVVLGLAVVALLFFYIQSRPKTTLHNEITITNHEEMTTAHLSEELKKDYEDLNKEILMSVELQAERYLHDNEHVTDYAVFAGFTNSELAYAENVAPINAGDLIREFVYFDFIYRYYDGEISSETLASYRDQYFNYFSFSTSFLDSPVDDAYERIMEELGGAEVVTKRLHAYGFSDTLVASNDRPTATNTANQTSVKDLQTLIYAGLVGNPEKDESFNKAAATIRDHFKRNYSHRGGNTLYPFDEEVGTQPQLQALVRIDALPEGDVVFIFLGNVTSPEALSDYRTYLSSSLRNAEKKSDLTKEHAEAQPEQSGILLPSSLEELADESLMGVWEKNVSGTPGRTMDHTYMEQIRGENDDHLYIFDRYLYKESPGSYDEFYLIMDVQEADQDNAIEITYIKGDPGNLSELHYEKTVLKMNEVDDQVSLAFGPMGSYEGTISHEYPEKFEYFDAKSQTNALMNLSEVNQIIQIDGKNELTFYRNRAYEAGRKKYNDSVRIIDHVGDLSYIEVQ